MHNALTIESGSGNFRVLAGFLQKLNINAVRLQNFYELDKVLASAGKISVAIIDLSGFDDGIWDICKILRHKGIPMLVISHKGNIGFNVETERSVKGVFRKPVLMKEFADCIRSLISV